jgi:hypothetical protein
VGKEAVAVLGICPTITMIDGMPTMMDWMWVPVRSAIRWHKERYPNEEMFAGVYDGGDWE